MRNWCKLVDGAGGDPRMARRPDPRSPRTRWRRPGRSGTLFPVIDELGAAQWTHRTVDELEAGVADIRLSPKDAGTLELIVRRPALEEREVLHVGVLDTEVGLVGDTWKQRPSKRTPDNSAHPDMQLNIINSRLSQLIAIDPARRALAGDQLHVDLDLSYDNLPPGTRLTFGDGDRADAPVIEVTAQPHTGCAKFTARFGIDAMRFVSSDVGKELNLRGINAKVVVGGTIRQGDVIRKLA